MKNTFYIIASFLFLSLVTQAGVDSSGGGSGGNFSMSSGFKPGVYNVTILSPINGPLAGVMKYFKLTGARPFAVNGGNALILGDTVITQSNNVTNPMYYQMQFSLAYGDVYRVATSSQMTLLEFRGPLATILYAAMEQAGALVIAKNLDNNRHVVGVTYLEKNSFMCKKQNEGGPRGGISCTLWITPLPKQTTPGCSECGG